MTRTRGRIAYIALLLYDPSTNGLESAALTSIIGGSGSAASNVLLARAPLAE